jgi:hypothetical protein
MKKKIIAAIDKFSFAQMTSNSDGKTSGSGTAGLYIIFIGGMCFLLGCIDKMFLDKSVDILTQSIILVGIGASLLGYRKSKDSSGEVEIAKIENGAHVNQICDCPEDCECGNCDRCTPKALNS